jgi:hypothetical protein
VTQDFAPARADPEGEVDKHHRRAGGNREQHLPGLARAAARGLKGCGERAEDADRDQRFLDEQGVGGVPLAAARAEHGAEAENPEGGKERRAAPDCAGDVRHSAHTARIARHLRRACFSLFIASGSFFLGQIKILRVYCEIRLFPSWRRSRRCW